MKKIPKSCVINFLGMRDLEWQKLDRALAGSIEGEKPGDGHHALTAGGHKLQRPDMVAQQWTCMECPKAVCQKW